MKNIFPNQPLSFKLLVFVIIGLVLFTATLYFYVQIVGVYAVANITGGTPTSEGIDYEYEFYYLGKKYHGSFSNVTRYELGEKYFVLFSKQRPSINFLRYNKAVPGCFKDSIFTYWKVIPRCSIDE